MSSADKAAGYIAKLRYRHLMTVSPFALAAYDRLHWLMRRRGAFSAIHPEQ
jgi:hypothetical protein